MSNRKRKQFSQVNPQPAKKVVTMLNSNQQSTKVVVTPISNQFDLLGDKPDEILLTTKKKEKVPPIMVNSASRQEIQKFMKEINVTDYSMKPLKSGVQIYCQSSASHGKVREELKKSNVGFYTHDLPEDKSFRVVLSGLHKMEIADLKTELKTQNVEPVDIKIISPRTPRYQDHVNYILYFKKNSVKLQDLQKIRTVCYTVVKWEPYRKIRNNITQCSRCQRPGHGGRHCNMPLKCVYCAEPHESNKCTLYLNAVALAKEATSEEMKGLNAPQLQVKVPAKCANCGGEHFASDPECLTKKKYEETRRKNSARNNHGRRNINPPPTEEDFRFVLPGTHSQEAFIGNHRTAQADQQASTSWAQQVSGAASPPDSLSMNTNPFSMEEILSLTSDVLSGLQNVRSASRSEVIRVVMQVSLKYLYNDSNNK